MNLQAPQYRSPIYQRHDSDLTKLPNSWKRDCVKVHLMCGVKTNVVTAVQITDPFAGDSPLFKPLSEVAGQNFTMAAVSADKT